mgnify:CR=1 FL=1
MGLARPARPAVSRLARAIVRRPWATLAVAAIAVVAAPLGIRRLEVQDSWISGFAPESEFHRATTDFNRRFFGAHVLLLARHRPVRAPRQLTASDLDLAEIRLPREFRATPAEMVGCDVIVRRIGDPSDQRPVSWESIVETARHDGDRIVITTPPVYGSPTFLLMPVDSDRFELSIRSHRLADPVVLRRIQELERVTRSLSRYTVGRVIGPPDQIETAELIVNERLPDSRVIPSEPDRVRWLWRSIANVQGLERRGEVVDTSLSRGLVSVFLKEANYRDTRSLMDSLRAYERERLAPVGIRMAFAGDVAVSQALIGGIVTSQIRSLVGSLLGILIVTALLFRSPRWGCSAWCRRGSR